MMYRHAARDPAKRVLSSEARVQGFSLTAMAGLFVPGGVYTSLQPSVTLAHFIRHLDFRQQPKAPLIVPVPLSHLLGPPGPLPLISNSDGRNRTPLSSAIFAVSSRIKSCCSMSLRCVPAESASVSMFMM